MGTYNAYWSENQPLPLRSITLRGRPAIKRSIAWSCDAELAVAVGESVHVLAPEYPPPKDLKNSKKKEIRAAPAFNRPQFPEGYRRHIPVSYPATDPYVNRHLYDVAGLEFPKIDPEMCGAGQGFFTSVGSSLNHVIAVEWSPNGMGRNGRPVLAILSGHGMITAYGEGFIGGGDSSNSTADRSATSQGRDLEAWIILWGVGGGMRVPNETTVREKVTAFAWGKEIGPGKALLAYQIDRGEVVVLAVQSRYAPDDAEEKEKMAWQINEVGRFDGSGPHPKLTVMDEDWSPSGSVFSLSWSPWTSVGGSKTCLLCYVATNYIGFRRVSVEGEWEMGSPPAVQIGDQDVQGVCQFLSTDAFVTWENKVWQDNASVCRGILATPFEAVPFKATVSGPHAEQSIKPHKTRDCDTLYPRPELGAKTTNPIMDLIIHPPNPDHNSDTPSYTAIRMSATASNPDWYETNLPEPHTRPQWATEVQQRCDVAVPFNLLAHKDATPSDGSGSDPDLSSDEDDEDEDDFAGHSGPEIHPHRLRLWALATSPGAGAGALLATQSQTQYPDTGSWHNARCVLLFDGRGRVTDAEAARGLRLAPAFDRLSTEGRAWEYLYGGGPPVPGYSGGPTDPIDRPATDARARMRAAFADVVARQVCAICGRGELVVKGDDAACPQRHLFDVCAATGVIIQEPGVSQVCGVCGSRSMKADELVKVAPHMETLIRNGVSTVRCGGCGGKLLG